MKFNKLILLTLSLFSLNACVELNQVVNDINSAMQNTIDGALGGVSGAIGMGGAQPTEAQKQKISRAVSSYRGSSPVLKQAISDATPNMVRILTYLSCNPYGKAPSYQNGLGSLYAGSMGAGTARYSTILAPIGMYEEKSAFHPKDKCLTVSSISRWGSLDAQNNYKYAESFSALVNYTSDYSNRVNITYIIDMKKDNGHWKVQCHMDYDKKLR